MGEVQNDVCSRNEINCRKGNRRWRQKDHCEAKDTTLSTSSLPSPESMLPSPYTEQPSFLPDILSDIYASTNLSSLQSVLHKSYTTFIKNEPDQVTLHLLKIPNKPITIRIKPKLCTLSSKALPVPSNTFPANLAPCSLRPAHTALMRGRVCSCLRYLPVPFPPCSFQSGNSPDSAVIQVSANITL